MKIGKKWLWVPGILLILALLFFLRKSEETAFELQTTVAYTGSIQETADGSGVLEGVSSVDISAETGGLIDSIPVSEGDTVQAGQLVLKLDATQSRFNLSSAGASVESSRIYLQQAQRDYERISDLYREELASTEEFLAAGETVELRTQELYRANASWGIASDNLDKTSYYTPVNGIVTALNVEVGEMAVQGTMNSAGTVLMTIEDMSSFRIRVNMVESEVVSVREGMRAEVVLDALPDSVFTGVVEQVGLSASSSGGGETAAEFEVLLKLDSVSPSMRSGMSASVEIVIAGTENTVIVPVQSIVDRRDPDDPRGLVPSVLVLREGIVRSVPVTVGVSSVMEVAVTGLSEGETVITGPVEALRTLQDGDDPGESGESDSDSSGFGFGMGPGMNGGMGGPPPGAGSGGQGGGPGGR